MIMYIAGKKMTKSKSTKGLGSKDSGSFVFSRKKHGVLWNKINNFNYMEDDYYEESY